MRSLVRTEATAGAEEEGRVRRPWRALSVCLVAAFMTLLDVSIVNVALPSIKQGLHASEAGLQWILSGYALTFGLVLVPAGRLGDARSRRAVFMTGLAVFTAASALAGIAPTMTWLVLARLVQGVAGGILNPQVAGLIQQLFQGGDRGRAFGALGAVIGIATAAGRRSAATFHGVRAASYASSPGRCTAPPHRPRRCSAGLVAGVLAGVSVVVIVVLLSISSDGADGTRVGGTTGWRRSQSRAGRPDAASRPDQPVVHADGGRAPPDLDGRRRAALP